MLAFASILLAFASAVSAQQTSFVEETGTRSLWIPFQTVSGVPLASIAHNDSSSNVTAYVLSCPTGQSSCGLSANLTLTEGPSTAHYRLPDNGGFVEVGCRMTGTTSAVCSQDASHGGNIQAPTPSTLKPEQIVYQAVDITATNNNTATMPVTVTVTAASTTTSSTMSSTGGATGTSGPWVLGGAVGAGLIALAAL